MFILPGGRNMKKLNKEAKNQNKIWWSIGILVLCVGIFSIFMFQKNTYKEAPSYTIPTDYRDFSEYEIKNGNVYFTDSEGDKFIANNTVNPSINKQVINVLDSVEQSEVDLKYVPQLSYSGFQIASKIKSDFSLSDGSQFKVLFYDSAPFNPQYDYGYEKFSHKAVFAVYITSLNEEGKKSLKTILNSIFDESEASQVYEYMVNNVQEHSPFDPNDVPDGEGDSEDTPFKNLFKDNQNFKTIQVDFVADVSQNFYFSYLVGGKA